VDSNVYISALVFGGVPQQVFDLIESQDALGLCISQPIMEEVAEVLARKLTGPPKNLRASCRHCGSDASLWRPLSL
jgi:predicted nucleic acid-binding protein